MTCLKTIPCTFCVDEIIVEKRASEVRRLDVIFMFVCIQQYIVQWDKS